MSRHQISLWTLSLVLGSLANAALADEPIAPQPKAADAAAASKPTKHAKRAKADAGGPAPTPAAEHKSAAGAPVIATPAAGTPVKHKHPPVAAATPPTAAAAVTQTSAPAAPTAKPLQPTAAVAKPAAPTGPICSLEEPEQPRGGRLDVLGSNFGQAPVVRVADKPVRMLERRNDRISVQVPVDSDGGPVTLQHEGRTSACGKLVIIGKNR